MEYNSIKKIYNGYSFCYDFIFKQFFHPRQKYAIDELSLKPGDRVLDVGVGTGLSLPLYPSNCEVVGIDISEDMLKQAKKKVDKYKLDNITLLEMDACNLCFEDDSFDHVVATHIISVVPEPVKVINEIRRVAKPAGSIAIVNHFVSRNPVVAKVENMCDPLVRKLGWRLDMSLDDFITDANLDVYKTTKLNKLDLWQVIHAKNNKIAFHADS